LAHLAFQRDGLLQRVALGLFVPRRIVIGALLWWRVSQQGVGMGGGKAIGGYQQLHRLDLFRVGYYWCSVDMRTYCAA